MSLGLPVALQFIDGRMKNTKANAPITARPINIKTREECSFHRFDVQEGGCKAA
jgi:hypothetical protein